MTTSSNDPRPKHRSHHEPDASSITIRDVDDSEEGVFRVRMPIASTGEVRNQGDEPLTRDEVDGMRQQIAERTIGVFLDHGRAFDISEGARYGATEKLGYWDEPELVTGDNSQLLEADAVLMDPETLPAATGDLREALSSLKEMAKRNVPLAASIGWRDDDSFPGGVDLMEASIVGIGADPRTSTQGAEPVTARSISDEGQDVIQERLAEIEDVIEQSESNEVSGWLDGVEEDRDIKRSSNFGRSL